MNHLNITLPTWLESLPVRDRPRARARFLLKIAACLATEEGSISVLSQRLGLHRNSLNSMLAQGAMDDGIPVNIIKAVEAAIGPGVIPRGTMNPQVYGE